MSSQVPLVVVTGATGFIASHIVKTLLEEGQFRVRGTVRSVANEERVNPIKQLVADPKYPLELVEADLLKDETWKEAVAGATYVIHVASPFPATVPRNADDVIKPAVDGTLSVLRAVSETPSVKRVVLTSSIVAIYDPIVPLEKKEGETEPRTFSEADWIEPDNPHLDAYSKSKVLAEKSAWDFVKEIPDGKNKFELATINPGMVMGPMLTKHTAASLEAVKKCLDKSSPLLPYVQWAVCDIRDVTRAHINALTNPAAAGQRHLIATQNMWMKDMAQVLQQELKPKGYFVPTLVAPNYLVWLGSLFDRSVKYVVPRLGREYKFDNSRMVNVLGITPTEAEKSLVDTAYSLIEFGIIKKTKKDKKLAKDAELAAANVNGEAVPEVNGSGDGPQVNGTQGEGKVAAESDAKVVVVPPVEPVVQPPREVEAAN